VGTLILAPVLIILRRLLSRQWFGILNALVAFYLLDQLRTVAASQPVLWRLLFLVEMLAACLVCVYLLIASHKADSAESQFSRRLRAGIRTALVLFVAVLLANAFGYGRLSGLSGNLLLSTSYLALVLYAAIRLPMLLSKSF
jgi:hypothetical protein